MEKDDKKRLDTEHEAKRKQAREGAKPTDKQFGQKGQEVRK